MNCPHCDQPLFRLSGEGSKLRARTKIIVLHKSAELEINCSECGQGVILGRLQELALRKAAPRLVVSIR